MPMGSGQPLVAVVTPVYNGGAIMERTLASVQAQTYPNIVHVILDNASTDVTAELIARFKNGRVPLLTRRNDTLLPQLENWNAAMAMVPPEARYVKLLPADDLMRADCIEKMVAAAESDREIDYVAAIDVYDNRIKPHGLEPSATVLPGGEFARRYLSGELTWTVAQHVFFRASPERLSDPFRAEGHIGFDRYFIFRQLLGRKMAFIHEPLLYTRYDERTVTARSGGHRPSMIVNFVILKHFGASFFSPRETRRLLRREYSKVLRHVLIWRLTGHDKVLRKTLDGLKAEGYEPGAFDYLRAILAWPAYKMRKRASDRRAASLCPPVAVPEAAFTDLHYAEQRSTAA
jgi:glycosyltransferase involved in cell wall biosynthesis